VSVNGDLCERKRRIMGALTEINEIIDGVLCEH
jgi:hypothetical protein